MSGLQIGDVVPEVMIDHILHYSSGSARLSDFKGRLLVLDFWETSCASCINAIPALERVQQEFGEEMRILTVSDEKEERVSAFLQHNPIGKTMRLPIVTGDKQLKTLFPHKIISHEVWISGEGKVLAITGAEYVNVQNIRAALAGTLHLPVKTDVMAFDYSRPLLGGGEEAPLYYSAVSGFKAGVKPRFGVTLDTARSRVRTYMFNFPLLQMYLMSLGRLLYFPRTMMDIRLADSSRVQIPAGLYHAEWNERNNWCYESVLPAGISEEQRMEAMRRDLNQFFGLNGRIERKKVRSLSLERLDSVALAVSKGGVPGNTLHNSGQDKVLINDSLADLIWELNDIPGGLPAVDNTAFSGTVDIRLSLGSFVNARAVDEALHPFGLTLKEKVQEITFFVLTDAGKE